MKTIDIDPRDFNALANMAQVAAERFRNNAAEFRKLIDYKPDPNSFLQIHGESARAMVTEFETQAREASRFAQIFSAAEDITIKYDEEMVEEDEA